MLKSFWLERREFYKFGQIYDESRDLGYVTHFADIILRYFINSKQDEKIVVFGIFQVRILIDNTKQVKVLFRLFY